MIICQTVSELNQKREEFRKSGQSLGFVPTMGALHDGHLSLIKRSKEENSKTAVSVFVNPTQFNNPDDLIRYPRTPEKDSGLLESVQTDLAFFPDEDQIYPDGRSENESFDFGNLERVMEGRFRPGHFKGVAQVVSRLFEIVNPRAAYFGEKDFQQLAIIRELVRIKKYDIEIVGCPTVREHDGLAMSSRNLLLTPEMRTEAAKISQALFYVRSHQKKMGVEELKQKAIEMISGSGTLKVEYLEIAEEKTLQPVNEWNDKIKLRCLTAVQAGNIRLIDNVQL